MSNEERDGNGAGGIDGSPLRGNLRLISVGAAALIVAVIAFLLLSGGDEDETRMATAPPPPPVRVAPEIVSHADLLRLSAELGHFVYWLGQRPGAELELARESNGDVYIRYLTGGAEAGDPRPLFVTVGTYPVKGAAAAVRRAAKASGAKLVSIPDGGVAFADLDNPGSVHFAYPGADYQIEVFTPKPGEALELVTSGKVRPVS